VRAAGKAREGAITSEDRERGCSNTKGGWMTAGPVAVIGRRSEEGRPSKDPVKVASSEAASSYGALETGPAEVTNGSQVVSLLRGDDGA